MAATTSDVTPRRNGFEYAALGTPQTKGEAEELERLRAAVETLSEMVIAHGVMDARTLHALLGDLIEMPAKAAAPSLPAAPQPAAAPKPAARPLVSPSQIGARPLVSPQQIAARPTSSRATPTAAAPVAPAPVANAAPAPVAHAAQAPVAHAAQAPVAHAAQAPVARAPIAQPQAAQPTAAPVAAAPLPARAPAVLPPAAKAAPAPAARPSAPATTAAADFAPVTHPAVAQPAKAAPSAPTMMAPAPVVSARQPLQHDAAQTDADLPIVRAPVVHTRAAVTLDPAQMPIVHAPIVHTPAPAPQRSKNPFDAKLAPVDIETALSTPDAPSVAPAGFFGRLFNRKKASPAQVAAEATSIEFTERVPRLPDGDRDGLYGEQQRATELSFPPTEPVLAKPRAAAKRGRSSRPAAEAAPSRFCDRCWRKMDASGTCKTCSAS